MQATQNYVALANATSAAVAKALKQHDDADTKDRDLRARERGVGDSRCRDRWCLVHDSGGRGDRRQIRRCAIHDGRRKVRRSLWKLRLWTGQVHTAYKDVIHSAMTKIQAAERDLLGEENELFAQIPATIDVNSPAFGYQNLAAISRPLIQFGPKVEAEHRKPMESHMPAGVVNPDSQIRRRLDG